MKVVPLRRRSVAEMPQKDRACFASLMRQLILEEPEIALDAILNISALLSKSGLSLDHLALHVYDASDGKGVRLAA